jgi:hypothetical protein
MAKDKSTDNSNDHKKKERNKVTKIKKTDNNNGNKKKNRKSYCLSFLY